MASATLVKPAMLEPATGLEMAQNSARVNWSREEVDSRLKKIMEDCFNNGLSTTPPALAALPGAYQMAAAPGLASRWASKTSIASWVEFKYIPGARPWTNIAGRIDVALPSATQNEVSGDEVLALDLDLSDGVDLLSGEGALLAVQDESTLGVGEATTSST
jgi:glutamate dehydrogenase/leucine dehydrogenase